MYAIRSYYAFSENGPGHYGIRSLDILKPCFRETGIPEYGSAEIGMLQKCVGQISLFHVRLHENRIPEIGGPENCIPEIGLKQYCLLLVGFRKHCRITSYNVCYTKLLR